MIKISIGDLIALCEEFDVKFSLQETEQLGYRHLMYTFGPISFLTDLYEEFTYSNYLSVVKQLSATFPQKVFERYK